jgi:ankyrin repeat protein
MSRQVIKCSLLLCIALLVFAPYASTQEPTKLVTETELRAASAKAIKRIQHSQAVWYKKQTCTSCHHQLLPEITLKLASERGVPFDEAIAREQTTAAFAYLKDLDAAVQGYDYIDVIADAWSLIAARTRIDQNLSTAAYAQFIAARQLPDGSWPTVDARPPQAHSRFTTTAICASAIRHSLPAQYKGEQDARLRRAREWLLKTPPRTTEDRVFQLFGLSWIDANENVRKLAPQLLATQRADGGWSQLPTLSSDAYSTGEVLVALHTTAGLPTSDPAYQRGLRFLLKLQEADGSWQVKSRLHPPAPVSPPYVDAEFPVGHDQFISIMGTSWAVNALLYALPPQAITQPRRPVASDFKPAEQAEWMRVALTGSAAELKKLLDRGMKPDAKTAGGTTALMLAARDLEKVKLLVERGADVNVRAATGITPLMVAARHRGNVEVVRLLLQKGAKPNADKGVEVRNDASALYFAVMAGDVQTAEALLSAGAKLEQRMKVLGQFAISPLLYATFGGDWRMIEFLLRQGTNPNEVDDDGISLLAWATICNHVDTVQGLLARGAQVNHVDKHGMTPLLYAASIDFGDTAVLAKLIAAGADLKAKNKQGLTAFELAKHYQHAALANLLAGKVATR